MGWGAMKKRRNKRQRPYGRLRVRNESVRQEEKFKVGIKG